MPPCPCPNPNIAPVLIWEGRHCVWRIFCEQAVSLDEMTHREFLVAVSLRNPLFSNQWLRGTFEDIAYLNGSIYLCLVDEPYFERAKESSDEAGLGRQLALLHRQCEEQERRLKRVATAFRDRVSIFRWTDLEKLVPRVLFAELEAAFFSRKTVHTALVDQVKRALPDGSPPEELEHASVFLLKEFPVLIYTYYNKPANGLIDVYPGAQAPFFWWLERGLFVDELPHATKLAQAGPPLVYADVSTRAK